MVHFFCQRYNVVTILLVLVLLTVAWVPEHALGQETPQGDAALGQPITFTARPSFGGEYRAGSWVPIVVTLQNEHTDRVVDVRVRGSQAETAFAVNVDLPRGAEKSVVVYPFLPTQSRQVTVQIFDGTAMLGERRVTLRPHTASAMLVGVLTADGIPPVLPNSLADGTRLVAVPLTIDDLPERGAGLSSFDTLIVNDLPTTGLDDQQRDALYEWVLRGGQVIVAGNVAAAQTWEGMPAALRFVTIDAAAQQPKDSVVPYRTIAASGATASPYPIPITLVDAITNQPQVLEQTYGNGTVTFVAASLTSAPFATTAKQSRFWEGVLHQRTRLPTGFAAPGVTADGFVEGNIASVLTLLPALDFPPLLLLGGLLLAYILLVGPVTYIVLRRLDRQMLGWAVVPAITLVFAVLTYGMGYAQRGGDVVFNQITLVEPLNVGAPMPAARVRSFVGVFSPSQRAYTVAASNTDTDPLLLRPLSIYGPWDTGNTAQGGVFVQGSTLPDGDEAAVEAFEIPQWTMRAFTSDTVETSYDQISSRLIVDDTAMRGEVVNTSARVLDDVVMVQGNSVARIGRMVPGERRSAELVRERQPGMPDNSSISLSYLLYGDEIERTNQQNSEPLPLSIQLRMQLVDALYSYGPTPRSGQPLVVAWGDNAPFNVQVPAYKADRQQLELITFVPEVQFATTQVSLESSWLDEHFDATQEEVCYGNQGPGVYLNRRPMVATLSLPRTLIGLDVSELTLTPARDGGMDVSDVVVELYDWQQDAWIDQSSIGRTVEVADPARFVGSHGKIQVRMSNATPNQGDFTCFYLDAALKGATP